MIPVTLQPEPADFAAEVRQPGRVWLTSNGIALNSPPPKASDLPNYWTHSNKQLWDSYGGVCAYLAIYFEWVTGASSTDHFVAKSKNAGDAYEWSNYRLSCLGANRNKGVSTNILDPIGLQADTFFLNLSTGEIMPNSQKNKTLQNNAERTIEALKLNSPENKKMRADHYKNYLNGDVSSNFLKKNSPFVWDEANRQKLL